MNRYDGTGWFWQQYDHNHAALVPMSTQYETPPLRWRHAETCAVDRMSGFGCTCKTTEEMMNDAAVPQPQAESRDEPGTGQESA